MMRTELSLTSQMVAALLFCLHSYAQTVAPSPVRPWKAPGSFGTDLQKLRAEELHLDAEHVYTLGELIDLAEEHNPETRAAWEEAKSRAAAVGVARSQLYPTLVATVMSETLQTGVLFNNQFVLQREGLYEPELSLTYLIFDFGSRQQQILTAQANLAGANLRFNTTHLNLIYEVTEAFYRMQSAIGQQQSAEANLVNAQSVQNAAEALLHNGLATRPDFLEAKSATARAQYDLQSTIAQREDAFGDLATSLAASPVAPFQIEDLNGMEIPDHIDESAQAAIERGLHDRPELLERVTEIHAADAEIKSAKSAFYPTLSFSGHDGFLRAYGVQPPYDSTYAGSQVYDAQLNLNWTVFDGLERKNALDRAKADRRAAEARLNASRDQVEDQVWRAYADVETAFQQRKAAVALLASSEESFNASKEAYQAGVRNILDVISAQRALAEARSADVTSRTRVLNDLAQLAFRTGSLLTDHIPGTQP